MDGDLEERKVKAREAREERLRKKAESVAEWKKGIEKRLTQLEREVLKLMLRKK